MRQVDVCLVVFILLGVFPIAGKAQLMQGGLPRAMENPGLLNTQSFAKVEALNVEALKQEDKMLDTIAGVPWRFGENIPVHVLPDKEGDWHKDLDGGRLWQYGIISPGALSINLVFHPYRLPPGAELFVYSSDGKEILGAFDHRNNQDDGYFATSLIFSDSVIVEYFEPAWVAFEGEFSIVQVTHGYRGVRTFADKAFGDSGYCNINVACDVALPYADQVRAVGLMLVGSDSFCTGSLINNTNNDGTPFFLSANHCYKDPSTVVIWFNWESETCENPEHSPPHQALSGAVDRARYVYSTFQKTGSDMWLLELNDLPPYEYDLFYSGWNRAEDASDIDSVVAVHHPSGDVKKFSWSTDDLVVSGYGPANPEYDTHWKVTSWDAGTTTEGGSSGSPLLDNHGRIIGQLHGGLAACGNTDPDWYGRLAVSWEGGGDSQNRLKDWLDPDDTDAMAVFGYQPEYHFIESSVAGGHGGVIDPSAWVMENRDYTFYFSPWQDYLIADVLVNGQSVGAVDSYTFENVNSGQTIEVVFAPDTFTIMSDFEGSGIVEPQGEVAIGYGSDITFVFTPDEGYQVVNVWVDGESLGVLESYTFENVTSDHTLHVTFDINTYTIIATASSGGVTDPSGEIEVTHGSDKAFVFSSFDGYHIADILVDGISIGALDSHTFENVTSDHTLHAVFEVNTYTVTATHTHGGFMQPEGYIAVSHGDDLTFNIETYNGYHMVDVLVDEQSVGMVNTYTFENITSSHTISAIFATNTYIITASSGSGGTIEPQGEVDVNHGEDQLFFITPSAGYHISNVKVDGESMGDLDSFTFENVTSDHLIEALFSKTTYTLTLEVFDEQNNFLNDAEVTLEGESFDPGVYMFDGLEPGSYSYLVSREGFFPSGRDVEIFDSDVTEQVILVVDDTGVVGVSGSELQIYPNPASNQLFISCHKRPASVQLVDMAGRVIAETTAPGKLTVIDTAMIQDGFYVVRVVLPDEILIQKVQVKK